MSGDVITKILVRTPVAIVPHFPPPLLFFIPANTYYIEGEEREREREREGERERERKREIHTHRERER